jgi:hypothetical protein
MSPHDPMVPTNFQEKFVSDHEDMVARVQKLVNQSHSVNLELERLTSRIPPNLDARVIKIELQLERLIKDVESEYVSKTDFEVLKVEHAQMKHLMWGFVALVLTTVVGALLALVVHNASLITK